MKIFAVTTLIKALPYLIGAGIVVGAAWFVYGLGHDRGYATATKDSEEAIEELLNKVATRGAERDQEWQAQIDVWMQQLLDQEELRLQDANRQQELLTTLEGLTGSILEIQNDAQTTDLGVCTFTSDFDRVLLDAYNLTTATRTGSSSDTGTP